MKKIISIAILFSMVVSMFQGTLSFANPGPGETTSQIETSWGYESSPYDPNNNYSHTESTPSEWLFKQADGTFWTLSKKGELNHYEPDGQTLKNQKVLPIELSYIGGAFSGATHNYVAYGRDNNDYTGTFFELSAEEKKRLLTNEVIRIVKYDKNWNRVSDAREYGYLGIGGPEGYNSSITSTGSQTKTIYKPFVGSPARFAEQGDKLVLAFGRNVHNIHYTTDLRIHQASAKLELNTSTMKWNTGGEDSITISHSFNVFPLLDGNDEAYLQHGDAGPRSIIFNKKNGTSKNIATSTVLNIPGTAGVNFTGVTVNGLEVSSNNYLAFYTTIDHSRITAGHSYGSPYQNGLDIDQRDIKLSTIKRNGTGTITPTTKTIAAYVGTDKVCSNPRVIKKNDNLFAIVWEEFLLNGKKKGSSQGVAVVQYVDGNGEKDGEAIRTTTESIFIDLLNSNGKITPKLANDLALGVSKNIDIVNGKAVEVKFTAPYKGKFVFESLNPGTLNPAAYYSNNSMIDDDKGEGNNCKFQRTLQTGETFTYRAGISSGTASGNYQVRVTNRSEHPVPTMPSGWGAPISLSLDSDTMIYIKDGATVKATFTAPVTGTYVIESLNDYGVLPQAWEDPNHTAGQGGSILGFNVGDDNFRFEQTLSAGQTFAFGAGRSHDNSKPSYEQAYDGIYEIRVTEKSKYQTTSTPVGMLTLNQDTTVNIKGGQRIEMSFKAPATGTYTFETINRGGLDPVAFTTMTSDINNIFGDDSEGSFNYKFERKIAIGQTFVYATGIYPHGISSGSYQVRVTSDYKIYTVKFMDGKTELKSEQVQEGKSATAPSTTKKGYTFDKWDEDFKTITGDLVINGKWTANKYAVKFDKNGGTGTAMKNQSFTYDKALKLTKNTYRRKGFIFAGWAEEKTDAVKYKNNQNVKNLADTNGVIVTLYTVWNKAVISKGSNVKVNKTLNLKTTKAGNSAIKSVDWKTSNKKVASIRTSGTGKIKCAVKGIKKGEVTITATVTFKDGSVQKLSRKVTVKK